MFYPAATQYVPGVQLRHFSPTCAVHIEDCAKCPGFDSQWLPTFSLSSIFTLAGKAKQG